jgi:putative choline sulfate-utilization transcription factor
MSKQRRTPSLHALAVFEAVGRHLSFSAAAEQLGTTQPAVSQRISALEAEIGTPLFRRMHRGVVLTPEGEHLHRAVRDSLMLIREAVAALKPTHERALTIATDFGFAAWWLMPRLGTFRQRFPDLRVNVLTAQDDVDLSKPRVDVAIFFGTGHWADCDATPLFPEVVVPVCAPAILAGREIRGPADWKCLPLLHLEAARPGRWFTWHELLSDEDFSCSQRQHDLTFNNYHLVLQAALMKQGVALGWRPLIDPFLADGQLVVLPGLSARTQRGYFLVEPRTGSGACARSDFCKWLMQEAGTTAEAFA